MNDLEELDRRLAELPATPTNDSDLEARAELMRQRCELIGATRRNPQAASNISNMVAVFVPDGGPSCVASRSEPGRYYYAEIDGNGRRTIRMPWAEFYALVTAPASNGGPTGGMRAQLNPSLIDRLPKNPQPPVI
jgi:hypothetical protein